MNCNGLYEFEKCTGGLSLKRFLAADGSSAADIAIPGAHEGLPVLEVGFEAFAGARFLRSAVIPESIHRLGGGAFRECTALESVRIPGSIRQISAAAFLGCSGLKSAVLCEGVAVIGSNAFRRCTALESVTLPKSIRSIESCAFLESPKLPAEIVMMGFTGLPDHTKPFKHYVEYDWENALREDVFTLALKYNGFCGIGDEKLLEEIFSRGSSKCLSIMEDMRYFTAERLDALIESFVQKQNTGITAWLLEYKKRAWGFDTENGYEL